MCGQAEEGVRMPYIIFFLVLHVHLCNSFILLNVSNTARLSSFEFQQLSQLLINEEHSRNHMENDLTSLVQRVSEIEHDLKKYAQDIADAKDALEGQMNHTQMMIRKDIYTTKITLNRQTKALEKEQSNRRQLERDYTRLMLELHNLSLANTELGIKNAKLEETIGNNTKHLLAKLLSVISDIQAVNISVCFI